MMLVNGRISNDKNKGRIKCDFILRIFYKYFFGRESVEGVLGRGVLLRFLFFYFDYYKFVDFFNLFDKRNYLYCDMLIKGSCVSIEFFLNFI